ncbi:beta-lactam-binding protein with PASTA domain [Mycobacterium frederiksbergense]|uniref:Beta-lactam-binding protein with PASTA domain n=1 Tax=Mycolicibacterium frederiksbergense TaxID=117567 RepID=A0ABT6L830_9MYCO|nr:PASTA domain-containing protein [Mycolicibacterium frederiksbergense]MDH6199074.1 beta-lactam-binding protein with PASTA domain [Mycolicibacterium frederiksbergense]
MKRVLVAVAGVMAAAVAVTSPTAMASPSWTMPNLIGMDLQGAQDAIQSLTRGAVWFSSSTDLTGKGRAQISDRNWQVCSSTPPPGAQFGTSTKIDFGVVRIDTEECP